MHESQPFAWMQRPATTNNARHLTWLWQRVSEVGNAGRDKEQWGVNCVSKSKCWQGCRLYGTLCPSCPKGNNYLGRNAVVAAASLPTFYKIILTSSDGTWAGLHTQSESKVQNVRNTSTAVRSRDRWLWLRRCSNEAGVIKSLFWCLLLANSGFKFASFSQLAERTQSHLTPVISQRHPRLTSMVSVVWSCLFSHSFLRYFPARNWQRPGRPYSYDSNTFQVDCLNNSVCVVKSVGRTCSRPYNCWSHLFGTSYCLQEGRERPGSRSLVWHDSFWLSILFCAGRASQERQML